MSTPDLIALSAKEAAEQIRHGHVKAEELFEAYRSRAAADAAAGEDGLNAYTWGADGAPDAGAPPAPSDAAPLAGVPLAVKDLFCTEGVPSQSGSRILAGYRPPYSAHVVERPPAARTPLVRQDHP